VLCVGHRATQPDSRGRARSLAMPYRRRPRLGRMRACYPLPAPASDPDSSSTSSTLSFWYNQPPI
jgi:hypothetical protein